MFLFCLSVEDELDKFSRDGGGTVGFSEFLAIMQRTTLHKLVEIDLSLSNLLFQENAI